VLISKSRVKALLFEFLKVNQIHLKTRNKKINFQLK
jgi:hypothetical protein